MLINDVIWDAYNVEHIWDKHRISPGEVEDVSYGHHIALTRLGRYVLYGKTSSGRYLKVIVEPISAGQVRPSTAFEMSDIQKRRYRYKGK